MTNWRSIGFDSEFTGRKTQANGASFDDDFSMTLDDVFGWSAIGLCLAGMTILFIAVVTWPRGERVRCPGPSSRLLQWIDLRRLFVRGSCWYDLTGLSIDDSDHLRCPECGTRMQPRSIRIDGRRIRVESIGILMLVLSIAAFLPPWTRGGSWIRSIPTLALAVIERAGADQTPRNIHDEVYRRVTDGTVTGWSADILARSLAHDLRDDNTHWNADRAEDLLAQMKGDAIPALNDALIHGDAQQRLLSARILRRLVDEPSPELLSACVEDLRDDGDNIDWYLSLGNASSAANYLVLWADSADLQLANGMLSSDRQQRLLCAAVAGQAGLVSLIDDAAPILIEHLRDNKVSGDAKVAAPALFGFGPAIVPYLQPHVDSPDRQLRATARAIIERINNPDRSLWRLKSPMPHITDKTDDPLLYLSIGESASDLSWPR